MYKSRLPIDHSQWVKLAPCPYQSGCDWYETQSNEFDIRGGLTAMVASSPLHSLDLRTVLGAAGLPQAVRP